MTNTFNTRLRAVRLSSERSCLICGCRRLSRVRGLCRAHYGRAQYAISQGMETWEALIRRGLALPARKRIGDRERRMRKAILAIYARGEYPSVRRITLELHRSSRTLSASECEIRREVFEELGIKLSRRGTAFFLHRRAA